MKHDVESRLGVAVGRLISSLDARLVRRSHLESLEHELAAARRQLESLRSQRGGPLQPNAAGVSTLAVPLFHHMKITALPASHMYRRVEAALDRHLDQMRLFVQTLTPLLYGPDLARVPHEREGDTEPYWNNGYFIAADARTAYALTAHLKPGRIIEVGGGNSTKFFRRAIRDHALATRLVTIDPYPRAEIDAVSDEVIRRDVKDVDPSLFASLAAGDFLFLDGSHLAFSGTDVVHSFLEILPVIRPGVLVHVHDIQLPFEYCEEFAAVRRYNEQYLLAVVLLFSGSWTPILPVHYLAAKELLRDDGVSFWMRRD